MMRCELSTCRGVVVERVDRIGRVTFHCAQCERRKRGVCRYCPRPVYGAVGVTFYCEECKKIRRRKDCMRWQKNNLDKVAEGARKRRWKEKGMQPPAEKMTLAQAGKIGGPLGAAARVRSLGPERVKEIAKKAREARWAKYYARKRLEEERGGK